MGILRLTFAPGVRGGPRMPSPTRNDDTIHSTG
jgi:hypothetical protein